MKCISHDTLKDFSSESRKDIFMSRFKGIFCYYFMFIVNQFPLFQLPHLSFVSAMLFNTAYRDTACVICTIQELCILWSLCKGFNEEHYTGGNGLYRQVFFRYTGGCHIAV